MPDDFTLIRVSKPVVRRLNVAKSLKGKDQQEVADDYLTESMNRDQIPESTSIPQATATGEGK